MIITRQPTIRTGAIPRVWLPVPAPSRPLQEERDDAALLAQLALLCANSYDTHKRTAVEYFLNDSKLNYATHRQAFGRGKGRLFWRPLAFILMPFNCLAILVWLVFLRHTL